MTEIGPTLREARMRARVDITEVEQATKIRTKYLRAMEDEEWGVLPGTTFAKSFLRTYADYLGLDSRLLVEEFKRRYERPAESELWAIAPARGGREPRGREPGRRRAILVVASVLALVLGGLFAIGKLDGGGSPASKARTDAVRRPRQRPARRPATPVAANVRLQLVPTGSVYVCLVDGRGRRLLSGVTLSAGSPTRTFAARRLLVTLGNASVRLRVNGREVRVPPSSRPISYVLTPRGRRTLPAARAPSCA